MSNVTNYSQKHMSRYYTETSALSNIYVDNRNIHRLISNKPTEPIMSGEKHIEPVDFYTVVVSYEPDNIDAVRIFTVLKSEKLSEIVSACSGENVKYCSNPPSTWVTNTMTWASEHGYVPVLDTLINKYPKEFEYVQHQIIIASSKGHTNILEWFYKNIGTESRTVCDIFWDVIGESIDKASEHGHVNVLDWYVEKFPLTYADKQTTDAVDGAARNGYVEVMDWWHVMGDFKYTHKAVDYAAYHNHIEVIEWLFIHDCYDFLYSVDAIANAARNNHVRILDWFFRKIHRKDSPMLYNHCAIDDASSNGHTDVLNWFSNHSNSLPILCTDKAITNAIIYDHWYVLTWFSNNKLPLKMNVNSCKNVICSRETTDTRLAILKWIIDNIDLIDDVNKNNLVKSMLMFYAADKNLKMIEWFKNQLGNKIKFVCEEHVSYTVKFV